jgi:hypothetical protein
MHGMYVKIISMNLHTWIANISFHRLNPRAAHRQTDTCQKALSSGRPIALVSATKKDESNS